MTHIRRNNGAQAKSIKLEEIARLVNGELVGDGNVAITGIAGIKEAEKGDITFLANVKYLPFLADTRASAVITSKDVQPNGKTLLRTTDPSQAFSRVLSLFSEDTKVSRPPGIHPTAFIDKSARLGQGVFVGAHAVIEEGSVIGDDSVVDAGSFIGRHSILGSKVRIHPNVTVGEYSEIGSRVIIHSGTVIGSDGFGYETVNGAHLKIPQTGWVCIEDDVEIGANVCIDRGRFSRTWIQRGTKIDNLVQVAHNVVIGPDCLIVSQSGISGSTTLGKNVILAGQSGLVGHIELGDNTIVGARSGVTKSVPSGSIVLGEPAKPIGEQKRLFALIARLPELFKEFAELKKKIK